MDLNKYINDNLEDILDNPDEFLIKNNNNLEIIDENKVFDQNEDDYEDDYIGDLHQNMYELKVNKLGEKQNLNNVDEGYYYINLINIFVKYYNEKFDKKENFFSGINNEKDTSTLMEMFFECIIEYKIVKEKFNLNDENSKQFYYTDDKKEEIQQLFKNYSKQIYSLEINNIKIITPSLLICLNYIFENNFINNDWKIFNLRNIS